LSYRHHCCNQARHYWRVFFGQDRRTTTYGGRGQKF